MQSVCADITVTRDLPETATPGSEVTVNLKLDIISGETSGIIVMENVPDGWSVSSISNEGSFDSDTEEIKWLIYAEKIESQTLSYIAVAPSKAGEYKFNGTCTSLEEGVGDITGNEKISVEVGANESVREVKGDGEGEGYDMKFIIGIIALIVVIILMFIFMKKKK